MFSVHSLVCQATTTITTTAMTPLPPRHLMPDLLKCRALNWSEYDQPTLQRRPNKSLSCYLNSWRRTDRLLDGCFVDCLCCYVASSILSKEFSARIGMLGFWGLTAQLRLSKKFVASCFCLCLFYFIGAWVSSAYSVGKLVVLLLHVFCWMGKMEAWIWIRMGWHLVSFCVIELTASWSGLHASYCFFLVFFVCSFQHVVAGKGMVCCNAFFRWSSFYSAWCGLFENFCFNCGVGSHIIYQAEIDLAVDSDLVEFFCVKDSFYNSLFLCGNIVVHFIWLMPFTSGKSTVMGLVQRAVNSNWCHMCSVCLYCSMTPPRRDSPWIDWIHVFMLGIIVPFRTLADLSRDAYTITRPIASPVFIPPWWLLLPTIHQSYF